jgi:DNA repair protein RecO (recombination protein O)
MPEFTSENALVLSTRHLGENGWIVSVLTGDHGKYVGVLKQKKPPEIASFVCVRWQARLAEQMGRFYIEETRAFSVLFMDDKKRLACLSTLCALLDDTLPERQSYPTLYQAVIAFLNTLEEPDFLKNYVRLESALLTSLGFGWDTSRCAGGGNPNDLAYISPKTGRAVSREIGKPYHNKLLILPRFLWQESIPTPDEIRQGLILTGYFLEQYAVHKALPKIREQLF